MQSRAFAQNTAARYRPRSYRSCCICADVWEVSGETAVHLTGLGEDIAHVLLGLADVPERTRAALPIGWTVRAAAETWDLRYSGYATALAAGCVSTRTC